MGDNYNINSDFSADSRSDLRSGTGSEAKTDYGGDLAKDGGINLNKSDCNDRNYYHDYLGGGYTYEGSYMDSGEIGGSADTNVGTDLNSDFTNDDIRNSLDGSESEDSNGNDLNKYSKDSGNEQLDSVLDNFQENKWSDLSLEEQKQSMTDLADYVAADTGNENSPEIVFRDDMADGTYGGYNPETNTMEINENMLDNSAEAADTIAHEM